MLSKRLYLIRAFYDWIGDSGCVPYIMVNADYPGVWVPQDYVKEGKIILNIAPNVVTAFELTARLMSFQARFNGIAHTLEIPLKAVIGIYAKENGQGVVLDHFDEEDEDEPPHSGGSGGASGAGRGKLRVVK